MATLRNIGLTNNEVDVSFLRYIKFENVIGLEILSGKLLLHKLYGKRKSFSIFIRQRSTYYPDKLSIFKIFLYVILILLAKNQEK